MRYHIYMSLGGRRFNTYRFRKIGGSKGGTAFKGICKNPYPYCPHLFDLDENGREISRVVFGGTAVLFDICTLCTEMTYNIGK